MPFKPRDLIIDNHDREGIALHQTNRPAAGWLAEQRDGRLRGLPPDTTWWKVLPICGGSVIVPEPLAQFVREATIDDVMRAIEYANEPAMRTIAALFPEAVEHALQSRQKSVHLPPGKLDT